MLVPNYCLASGRRALEPSSGQTKTTSFVKEVEPWNWKGEVARSFAARCFQRARTYCIQILKPKMQHVWFCTSSRLQIKQDLIYRE
jgi:hypothetical protein